jgi:hypothetical protein
MNRSSHFVVTTRWLYCAERIPSTGLTEFGMKLCKHGGHADIVDAMENIKLQTH